jgi:sortase, SrtB family
MAKSNNTYQPKNPTSKPTKVKNKAKSKPKNEVKSTEKREKKENVFVRFLKYFFPWPGDKAGEVIRKILMIVVIGAFVASSFMVVSWLKRNYETHDAGIKQINVYENEEPTEEELKALPPGYLPEFAKFYSINQDVVGWISVPDTTINYTVAQAQNNTFYLDHNFDKKYHQNGWPFADANNTIKQGYLDDNTIIYAHNLRANLMFQNLVNFKRLDYYKSRPVVTFDTVYEKSKWKIFGVFIANSNTKDGRVFDYHKFFNADDDAHFMRYVREVKRRSIIETNVDVKASDKLLTLSTCTYEIDDGRFVVVARKVRPGESASVDVGGSSLNPNPLYPDAWYRKFGGVKPTYNDAIPWGSGRGGSVHGNINYAE